MTMYNKTAPEIDFVKRSRLLAEELNNHRFSTTLQINLLFGTVMLPKSHWYQNLQSVNIDFDKIPNVKITYRSEVLTAGVLLHCLRNGIAHWKERQNNNIVFISNPETNEIEKVIISGSGNVLRKKENIKVEFDILQNGLIEFMDYIISIIEGD